ncbi:MAG: hypothetical protein JWR62_2575, partial [Modestobacter sp.]|nr:hypothetical protein [Modestobacter sp.]
MTGHGSSTGPARDVPPARPVAGSGDGAVAGPGLG